MAIPGGVSSQAFGSCKIRQSRLRKNLLLLYNNFRLVFHINWNVGRNRCHISMWLSVSVCSFSDVIDVTTNLLTLHNLTMQEAGPTRWTMTPGSHGTEVTFRPKFLAYTASPEEKERLREQVLIWHSCSRSTFRWRSGWIKSNGERMFRFCSSSDGVAPVVLWGVFR